MQTRVILSVLLITLASNLSAQSFLQKNLNFNDYPGLNLGTSIMFGPDSRLYATDYPGSINIYSIERDEEGDYNVVSFESIEGLRSIKDHNDDGTIFETSNRQTLGITVVGTPENPIVYVTSSDFRVGGGVGADEDSNLDTNSGIVTRYTWTGSAWDEVDIVRGLPRSEENHGTNGIEFTTIGDTDYLIISQGGNTNAGAPSGNFLYQCEYALSAAVLSVNLDLIEEMPILLDDGRQYVYDLPTLDDPTRTNANGIIDPDHEDYDGIDIGDPFGGNDGLNQAIIDPDGPVQIFSPGYRNTYDLVVTESGAVYATENGANLGWGGFPTNEGSSSVNNNYDSNEPGSSTMSGGEVIANTDHLHLITNDISNYTFGSHYAGHPNPIRANPLGAGLFTVEHADYQKGVFRTLTYDPDMSRENSSDDISLALPANWPPVSTVNIVESDYRSPDLENPDGENDGNVLTWGTNTNGIDEYTASNFDGAMKGDLIAGHNFGNLRRVQLHEDGTVAEYNETFASGIPGNVLGITCNSDDEIFAGTIWTASLGGSIVVLEPIDLLDCYAVDDPEYDESEDYDFDRYANWDEHSNGTELCNGGSQPVDFDKAAGGILVSDLNDTDDDNDGILDSEDVMQLGNPLDDGSDAFDLPVSNELFSNTDLGGYLGLGFTGVMNNGDANPNWMNFLDRRDDPDDPNPNDVLGGAIGAMTMQMTSGTAAGSSNTQEKGFQYGVKLTEADKKIVVSGGMKNFAGPLQLYGHEGAPDGEVGFFIGDGSQSNFIMFVLNKNGFKVYSENEDIAQDDIAIELSNENRPLVSADLYLEIDRQSGEVAFLYAFDGSPVINSLTEITATGEVLAAIQSNTTPLMVGLIGTSNQEDIEVEGTWDYLEVIPKETWQVLGEEEDYRGNHECGFVQAGENFYLIGGRSGKGLVYQYDTKANNWSDANDGASEAFNHFQAVEFEGYIWVLSALVDNSYPSESPNEYIWIFDPVTKRWIRSTEVPLERRRGSAGAVVYKNKLYVVGGSTNGHNGGYVNWFDEYDPVTATWKQMPDAPRARDHFSAVVVDDKLYAIGGRLSGGEEGVFKPLVPEVDAYDFKEESWYTLDEELDIPTPRAAPSIALLRNRIYVMGGEVHEEPVYDEIVSGALTVTEIFDPERSSWQRGEDMNHPRHGTQAISSGESIYITAGSPGLGGGQQHNMEFFGTGIIEDESIVRPALKKSKNQVEMQEFPEKINLTIEGNGAGLYIESVDFSSGRIAISEGKVEDRLILPTTQIEFYVQCSNGLGENIDTVFIHHGNNEKTNIQIKGCAALKNVPDVHGEHDEQDEPNLSTSEVLDLKVREQDNSVDIYPNPTEDVLVIEASEGNLILSITLLGLNGSELYTHHVEAYKHELDLKEYEEGVYYLLIDSEGGKLKKKIVVLREK